MQQLRSGCLSQQRLASRAHFELDNCTLYNEFKPLIVDGPGWSFVTVHQRSSHASSQLTLRLQVQPIKEDRAKGFSFANYVTLCQTAHIELMDLDEPAVSESKKVTDFLEGICDDSKLTTGKSIVLGDPANLGNLEECQQYLSFIVQDMAAQRKRSGMFHPWLRMAAA